MCCLKQYSMNLINRVLPFILFLLQCHLQNSAPLQLSKNPYFISGRKSIDHTNYSTAQFSDNFYTIPIPNTVLNISKVYYSTSEIKAETYLPYYPGTANNFIWYEINSHNFSNTYLTTNIRAFFQLPFFHKFTFTYIIILGNNSLIGRYVVFDQIEFIPNITSLSTIFPSKYQTGELLEYSYLIKQIRKIYVYSDMSIFGFDYWIRLSISRSDTNRILNASIDLPPYVLSYGNYSVKYLVVIIANTAISNDYSRYKFATSTYSTSGTSLSINSLPNPNDPNSNLVFGMKDYYFYNRREPSFNFQLSFTNNSATYSFSGYINFGPSGSLGFTYVKLLYYDCNSTYFIYNQTNDICFDACLSPYEYFNTSLLTCMPCSQFCETCYDSQNCKTCFNGTNRQLINYQCVPVGGYYESYLNISSQCSIFCVKCQSTSTNCTECKPLQQVLLNNTCYPCLNFIQGCKNCNQSSCLSCISGYRFINQSFCNLPCNDSNCLICSNSNTSICHQCRNQNYIIINNTCSKQAICGDGIINSTQQCDDGNNNNHDGCSSYCKIEQYYQCTSQASPLGFNYTLYCSYTHPIDFTVISVEKIKYSNQLKIIISVQQYLEYFWNTPTSLGNYFFQTPIPYKNMKVQFMSRQKSIISKLASPQTNNYAQISLLAVYFQYLQSIHNRNVIIGFNFNSSYDRSLILIPSSSVSLNIDPENNHYAHLYSQQIYSQQQIISNIYQSMSIACLALFALSIFIKCKRIVAEMIVVLQIAQASLLTVPKITPMFSTLTSFSPINNIYNLMYSQSLRPFEDTLIDNRSKGAMFYSQFIYNYNLGLTFIFLPIFIGLVALIINRIKQFEKEKAQKMNRIIDLSFGQFTFVGLICSGCIVGVSFILQFQYGIKQISSFAGMMSLITSIILIIFYISYGVIRVKRSNIFDQYKNSIKQNQTIFSLIFQITYFYMGISSGIVLNLFRYSNKINIILALFSLFLFFSTWAKPIFTKPYDKYRTQLNLLSITIIQIPFIYSNHIDKYNFKSDDDVTLLMPMTITLILSINFIINLSFFIYQIIKMIRNSSKRDVKIFQDEYVSTKTEQFRQIYKISFNMLDSQISKPMFVKGFIDYSQKAVDEQVEMEELRLIKKIMLETKAKNQNQRISPVSRKLSAGADSI